MINEMDLRSSLPPMWFQTHTNMLSAFIYDSYKLLIPPLLYSEKVWKIILSCSLSCKRVHYQCLPKSLCLCSKRLSLLCFKRIISCPYKSTIILPLLKRLLPPLENEGLAQLFYKMVGLFWPWVLNYFFYASESDTDGRLTIKIIYKLKVNAWQKSNGVKGSGSAWWT